MMCLFFFFQSKVYFKENIKWKCYSFSIQFNILIGSSKESLVSARVSFTLLFRLFSETGDVEMLLPRFITSQIQRF